jgi:hypothetical protein
VNDHSPDKNDNDCGGNNTSGHKVSTFDSLLQTYHDAPTLLRRSKRDRSIPSRLTYKANGNCESNDDSDDSSASYGNNTDESSYGSDSNHATNNSSDSEIPIDTQDDSKDDVGSHTDYSDVNNDDNGSGNDQSTINGSFSPSNSIQDDEDIDTDINKVDVVSYFHSSQRKFTIKSFSSGLVFGCAAVVLRTLGESLLDIPLGKKTQDLQQEDRQQHLHIHVTKDLCYANSVDKITQVTPLPQRCVGSKNQLYAHPCPNKVLDLGCSTMRLEILRRFKNTGRDCPLSSSHTIIPNDPVTGTYTSDFCDDAFRAILLTVVGRPGLLGNYTRHNCKGYQDSYIPRQVPFISC